MASKKESDDINKDFCESEYSVDELSANAKMFGVMPECVIAAFRVAGKEKATRQDAEKIINDFMKKEVR